MNWPDFIMNSFPSTYSPTTPNATCIGAVFADFFNGKEKDYESGLHYYGARYYDCELLTGWLSVDPMADKYPNIYPYAYCAWNPVKLVDPDGRDTININLSDGGIIHQKAEGDHCIRFVKDGDFLDDKTINGINTELIIGDPAMWNDGENDVYTHYLQFEDSKLGYEVFNVITNECGNSSSAKEWDYYFLTTGGELSSSTSKNAIGHAPNRYTTNNVKSWHHFHPSNTGCSWFPSYADQARSRELGVPCYLYSQGSSWRFDQVVRQYNLTPNEYKKKLAIFQ